MRSKACQPNNATTTRIVRHANAAARMNCGHGRRGRGVSGAVMLPAPGFGRWWVVRSLQCLLVRPAESLAGRGHAGLPRASRPTAHRTETALLGIRHSRVRTRKAVEHLVRAVRTGATRAGARPPYDSQACGSAPRPGRSPQVRLASMGARRPVARTTRRARGADNYGNAACGGAGSPIERAAGGGASMPSRLLALGDLP